MCGLLGIFYAMRVGWLLEVLVSGMVNIGFNFKCL